MIFARWPILGGGKRRLAAGIGAVHAVRFQRVRLKVMLACLAGDPRWTTWLAVTPDHTGAWPAHLHVRRQGRGDLGQRMTRIMRSWPRGPVLIIGTDIPAVTAGDITQAFRQLGNHDAVFGPATDGGYWLIGLRRRPRILNAFGNVRWSSRFALEDTERNLKNVRRAHLRTLADVDDIESLATQSAWNRVITPR